MNKALAERALEVLSLEECLEILGRIETDTVVDWQAVDEAKKRVIRQMDSRDAEQFVGRRPKYVPKHAEPRMIATAAGMVDLWLWVRPNGNWDWCLGGPRVFRPRGGKGTPSKRDAVKEARWHMFNEYGKPTRKASARLRFLILERDAFTCRYCGRKAPDVELHVDHAIALADGGTDTADNLVTACRDCNLGKSGHSVPAAA